MLKHSLILLCLSGLLVACGKPDVTYSDGKGTTVTTSPDGAHVTATDESGKTVTMDTQEGKTTIQTDEGKSSVEVKDGKTTIKDEKSGMTAETGVVISEEELGVLFYPGSTEDKAASMKSSSPEGNAYLCVRTTQDSIEQIVAFYEKELKEVKTFKADGQATVSGKSADGVEVAVSAIKSPDSKDVRITVALNRK